MPCLSPRPRVLDAKRRWQVLLVGEPKPFGRRLAVEVHVKRLMPVSILDFADDLSIDIPSDRPLVPLEPMDVMLLGRYRQTLDRYNIPSVPDVNVLNIQYNHYRCVYAGFGYTAGTGSSVLVEETLADLSGILFVVESEGEAKPRCFFRLQFVTA